MTDGHPSNVAAPGRTTCSRVTRPGAVARTGACPSVERATISLVDRTGTDDRRRIATVVVALAMVSLAAGAAYADIVQGFTAVSTVADVAVGVTFGLAAAASTRPDLQRLLLALVGGAWLVGSSSPLVWLYRPALALALLAFPLGRLTTRTRQAIAVAGLALCAVASTGALSPVGVATVLFLGVAAVCATSLRRGASWRTYPLVAALAMAAVNGMVWGSYAWVPLTVTPGFWRSVVTGVLVLLALGHVPASRLAAAERARSVVGLLEQPYRAGGSDPLVVELREALGDRELRVLPWDAARGGYVDASGAARQVEPGWIEVRDADRPVAAVASGSPLLTDALTENQVADAVRLTIRARHRQAEREAQVAELEAARRRLLDAADAERQLVADRLQSEVLPYLRGATAALAGLRGSDVLTVVGDELSSAESDLGRLVDGVPPADLGGGRLVAALEELGRRTHLPVTVTAQPGWGLDAVAEQTLYYVASEALANVLKHARASTITMALRTEGDNAVLMVDDDGVGGADPQGLGLLGLADRVATRRGVLTVTSPSGGGTTLMARIPLAPDPGAPTRSWSTA